MFGAARRAVPQGHPHPCTYFRDWGTYHAYDYDMAGPPPEPGIVHQAVYVGRVHPVPELLSGCRKAPIMAVGINPNLPGWWPGRQNSLTPLFDDYRQYAHYFRYRSVAKLEIPRSAYLAAGGGDHDGPFSQFELPRGPIPVRLQPQKMYRIYQGLLDSLVEAMGWPGSLIVGEDLSYGNMVASASAKWTVRAAPGLPAMTPDQRDGIVSECFHARRYLLRQLFQSLPAVILLLGQTPTDAFLTELGRLFTLGDARPGEPVAELLQREHRLRYGVLPDGSELDARVIFAPHATGDPEDFAPVRGQIVAQLTEEARAGRLVLQSGHLARTVGGCVLCPLLEIGPCEYADELRPVTVDTGLTAQAPGPEDRRLQHAWLERVPVGDARQWPGDDDATDPVA